MTTMAGAKTCTWCGRLLHTKGHHNSLNYHRAVREAANILRQLTTQEQEDALRWLIKNLNLKKLLEEADHLLDEKSGSSASSTQAPSSEMVGPKNPGSGSSSDESEGS
jgi:hypothetical protein